MTMTATEPSSAAAATSANDDDDRADHAAAAIGDEEDDEDQISADECRRLANAHFAQRNYDTALPLYSAAVDAARIEDDIWKREEVKARRAAELASREADDGGAGDGAGAAAASGVQEDDDADAVVDPSYRPREPSAVLHLCNRSACLFKMERYEEARNDAREASELSRGRSTKAWFRLARAQMCLHQYSSAATTLESGLANVEREGKDLEREERDLEEGLDDGGALCMDDDDEEEEEDAEQKKKAELEKRRKELDLQRKELTKLLSISKKKKSQSRVGDAPDPSTLEPTEITSIKTEPRKPSIREFELKKEIGVGNFSRIVVCRHKTTGEEFALKIIEKKKAEQMAKRQHPNVYNEIHMERRILGERLHSSTAGNGGYWHPRIVKMYHAMQDYGSLYMLTELHSIQGDLWSQLRSRGKMVGCHPSLARLYLSELLDAVEHLHYHGIVHRDLKPENVVLSDRGHVVLLDLGTAKDMVYTDLNGPEFVGTPDYMAPEMVKGTSGDNEVAEAKRKGKVGADHTADLWAMGCIAYQLCTGTLPFAAPSPYLAFLRIQRGNLCRPWGVSDDDHWDLCKSLLRVNPRERLGADCFDFADAEVSNNAENSPKEGTNSTGNLSKEAAKTYGVGYDVIRRHPYFKGLRTKPAGPVDIYSEPVPVPSLRDLSVRAVAELVRLDSLDLDSDAKHPPGNGDSHDVLRLNPLDRKCVMHHLERTKVLAKPRAFRRFFEKKSEARLGRVRPESLDCVGLTQLFPDNQGQFPSRECGEGADPDMKELAELGDPIRFVQITNPLFLREVNEGCQDDAEVRKEYINQLKDSIRKTNRTRPKLALAVGYFDSQCRKLLAKINETIPVVLCDGSSFFSFWVCGAQCIFLRSRDFVRDNKNAANDSTNLSDVDPSSWLSEQLEQSRTASHHLFAFVDCDPRDLPEKLMKRLARGKTLCLYGIRKAEEREGHGSEEAAGEGQFRYEDEYTYEGTKEEEEDEDDKEDGAPDKQRPSSETAKPQSAQSRNEHDDDDYSVESAGEKPHTMKISAANGSSLNCVTLEEYGEWTSDVI